MKNHAEIPSGVNLKILPESNSETSLTANFWLSPDDSVGKIFRKSEISFRYSSMPFLDIPSGILLEKYPDIAIETR